MLPFSGVLILALFTGFAETKNGSAEFDIRRDVLDGYDKVVLPGNGERLAVDFALTIEQITDVKDKEQVVTISCWYVITWRNPYLKWDKAKYQNRDRVHFDPKEIWVPDISLLNNGDNTVKMAGGRSIFLTNVVVENTGKCIWSGPVTFTFTCSMALSRWPFDQQTCAMKFGSLSYGSNLMVISKFSTNASKADDFLENSNWELKEVSINVNETDHGDCCPFTYSQITYTLKMARKFKYHLFYLVAPCLIMVILSLFSFFVPSESGERIGFVTTLLLALMVFLLVVPDLIPESSTSIPILGIFLMATLVMVSLILMITIFVLVIYHKEGVPPPWIQKIFSVKPTPTNHVDVELKSRDNGSSGPALRVEDARNGYSSPASTAGPPKVFLEDTENNHLTYAKISEKLDNIFFVMFVVVACVMYSSILTQRDE
ncbi:acetylcholine receptor subunit alpha-like 1 [Nematostella vectensis]|uniref:acetylcholine receptor subunit alpha-like 1 n=1 Tax=Nematostella vectensis TaxID=45351 RepID=UPI0020772B37|nr:acetylcholine receptor subunit alpha-like 1 [Nematostella vectensis]